MSKITPELLKEAGFEKNPDKFSSFPWNKELEIRVPDEFEKPALTITTIHNSPELAFAPGDGSLFFLKVSSLEEALAWADKITFIDPPY